LTLCVQKAANRGQSLGAYLVNQGFLTHEIIEDMINRMRRIRGIRLVSVGGRQLAGVDAFLDTRRVMNPIRIKEPMKVPGKILSGIFAAVMSVVVCSTAIAASLDEEVARRKHRYDGPCHTLGVTRTYFDFSQRHVDWSLSDWRSLFAGFADLGLNEVILRSTSGSGFSIYESTQPEAVDSDIASPLEGLVMAAREAGVRVWAGLHAPDPAESLQQMTQDEVGAYFVARLEQHRELLLPLTLALLSMDPNGSVFRGWYVPDSVDADLWIDADHRQTLNDYLRQTRDMLERVQPSWPVMISAHARGAKSLSEIAKGWTAVLEGARIDVFLFQDGVGYRNLPINDLDDWLSVLSDEVQTNSRSLGVVVEPFDVGSALVASTNAEPAPFARVIRQLESARVHGREPVTMFSVSEYLSAEATAAMRRFHRRWWLDQRACRGTPRRFASVSY